MKVIWGGDRHDTEVRKITNHLTPGGFTIVDPGFISRPLRKAVLQTPGRGFSSSGHGRKLKSQRRHVARPMIESHPPQASADTGHLQVGVDPGVHIASKHSRADQRDFYPAVHLRSPASAAYFVEFRATREEIQSPISHSSVAVRRTFAGLRLLALNGAMSRENFAQAPRDDTVLLTLEHPHRYPNFPRADARHDD